MIITEKCIEELKRNNKLKALISIEHECTVYTIDRWIRTKDLKKLTTIAAMYTGLIQKETGFGTGDILKESTAKTSKKVKY